MSYNMSNNAPDQIKWMEVETLPVKPEVDEFPLVGNKTFKKSVLDKLTENIFVPLGLVATTACLTMGLVNMKRGNVHKQQLFMRGRVGFQFFTLMAMTVGVWLTQKNKSKRRNNPLEGIEASQR